jgi:CubicO group peptidase (beta-lactamase class C family)
VPRLIALIVVIAVAVLGQRTYAQQSFTESLFARYLDALREAAGIPGMSGLVLQDGTVVWERHFGRQDLESGTVPNGNTPYAIGSMSQIFGSTLLLKKCVDESFRLVTDRITDWIPAFSEPDATLLHLLGHFQVNGAYRYDAARFSFLTPIVEACANTKYERLLAEDVFSRLGLADSVPGTALAAPTNDDLVTFGENNLARYARTLSRLATPYAVDTRGRATRTSPARVRVNASDGVVTTVRDLARFDAALHHDILLERATQVGAWVRPAAHLPTGQGWFVQNYNGQAIVWQFGMVSDAYSSLIVKVPNRKLTFILLANSDGLSSPFALEQGDVTASLFARVFLLLYVP